MGTIFARSLRTECMPALDGILSLHPFIHRLLLGSMAMAAFKVLILPIGTVSGRAQARLEDATVHP
jgi:hypothetical protein